MRSGKLRAKHDSLIRELLEDPRYYVCQNGFVWTNIEVSGRLSDRGLWRKAGRIDTEGYVQIRYKGERILAHRIVYQKHVGRLQSDLVVNHKDANRQNNRPDNLELITQRSNTYYMHRRRERLAA